MKTLTRITRILHYIEQNPNRRVGAVEIARELQAPAATVSQLLYRLRILGIIDTKKGPKGGSYTLKPLSTLTISDLMPAINSRHIDRVPNTLPATILLGETHAS